MKILSKDLLIALVISSVVFSLTGWIAYEIATEIHTQGTDLLKTFM